MWTTLWYLATRWLGTGNKEEKQMAALVMVMVRRHETERVVLILDILSAKFLCDIYAIFNGSWL